MRGERGISTFIATLLLMVLAVAAGAIIYAYTMGYLGGLGSTKTPGTLSLDSAKATAGTPGQIKAYVRNIGKGTVTIEVAYVDGKQFKDLDRDNNKDSDGDGKKDIDVVTIGEGNVGEVIISTDRTSSKTYEVKLVATDGTNLVFTVKAS